MKKLEMRSADAIKRQILELRDLFPNCVTEAQNSETGSVDLAVDFDALRCELGGAVSEGSQERYRLDWPGKSNAIVAANTPINKTLRPNRNDSVNFDLTQNLFIEGDNLEVLKILQESYLGRVKLIYIDPPYNTGSDLIYRDDFSIGRRDFLLSTNQADSEGNRLIANTQANGRFHSDWLNMIYPRLKLARNLLSDDGLIFISIDENEVANLMKVCSEVFGLENFVGDFIRKTKSQANDPGTGVNYQHEFVLVYARSIAHAALRGDVKDSSNYTNPDNDPRGPWISDNPSARSGGANSRFEIKNPITGTSDVPPHGRFWAFSEKTFHSWVASGKVVFRDSVSQGQRGFVVKKYLSELRSDVKPIDSLRFVDNKYMNQVATKEMNELMGGTFSYPKPVSLIYDIIESVGPSEFVLDFFAGSSTTAHAVMKLNSTDGGNRKFIMVQYPEVIDKNPSGETSEYRTIADLSRDRIRRAGESINRSSAHQNWNGDIGFRVLSVDTSNMADVYYTPDATDQVDLLSQIDSIKQGRTAEDLLFQVLVDWGVDLTLPIRRETVQGKTVFFVDENALVACFDTGVTEELVKELAGHEPVRVVFRDTGFVSDAVKINVEQIFRQLSPSTEVKAI